MRQLLIFQSTLLVGFDDNPPIVTSVSVTSSWTTLICPEMNLFLIDPSLISLTKSTFRKFTKGAIQMYSYIFTNIQYKTIHLFGFNVFAQRQRLQRMIEIIHPVNCVIFGYFDDLMLKEESLLVVLTLKKHYI